MLELLLLFIKLVQFERSVLDDNVVATADVEDASAVEVAEVNIDVELFVGGADVTIVELSHRLSVGSSFEFKFN